MGVTEIVVNHGLQGIVALETDISRVDGTTGTLEYRGYNIHDLAAYASFEEVAYLLLHQHLPTRSELMMFQTDLAGRRALPDKILDVLYHLPLFTHPSVIYRTAISCLGSLDPQLKVISPGENLRKAKDLIAKTPTIIAYHQNIRSKTPLLPPREDLSHAANVLWMLNGVEPDPIERHALERALILHAEHTLNASTFAARISASTLSDMYACVVAATGTLFGPLHGGASQQVMEMLRALETMDRAAITRWVEEKLRRGEKIMGFGHRVYKTMDPRATELRKMAQQLDELRGNTWVTQSDRLADILYQKKGLYPNVDFYAASVYANLGIPDDQFINMFTLSRIVGWTTHMLDQYQHNKLIRPLQQYSGDQALDYIPLDDR
jgi:citrate synthase